MTASSNRLIFIAQKNKSLLVLEGFHCDRVAAMERRSTWAKPYMLVMVDNGWGWKRARNRTFCAGRKCVVRGV